MNTIFKTWQKATYFEGVFQLRDRNANWASPIDFPTVLTAYGAAIKSGNWQSCTAINTPDYVINTFFDTIGHNKNDAMYQLWTYCKELENINWTKVNQDESNVIELIRLANNELFKLDILK